LQALGFGHTADVRVENGAITPQNSKWEEDQINIELMNQTNIASALLGNPLYKG
jgi:hypothetical protein|tara:strand:+ start:194 stop:355 length:162 start_codon:yes stop_codon:yes gene_type:complete